MPAVIATADAAFAVCPYAPPCFLSLLRPPDRR
jgi:hypothetical protein